MRPGILEAAMRYQVLGPVEATGDDVVTIGGPQQRRLLALLLSRPGQPVSTERLVDCLWPDGLAPDGAARSVMTYVSRLRAALGDASISTVQSGYRLELNGSMIDSQQFESLLVEAGTAEPGRAVEIYDQALELWTGSAYGEFGSEWWLLAEASRLNELRVVAMEERAEALIAAGHHHRVIAELNRLTTEHPLRERPFSLLMQALFATGRHADALREFQSFRSRLVEETGLDPSPELTELERSMAAGRPVAQLGSRARLLRGYTVREVIGEGAFGRVFAATQPGTNRDVAIKAIRPDLANSVEFIQRFETEAQLVARLEHPHIVPLYDYWREPGGAYLVFRLLLGGSALGALVSEGPFNLARVSRLVEEVGSGLLAAHTAGVVHCDIKPSNVLFDESGNAYLADFGIAVTSAIQPQDGERTRVYAAPELTDRSGDTIQSDIFSFGCMLWELLTGVAPFVWMHPSSRTRLPSLAGSISEPAELLDAVLAKATAADADTRYESMAELIVAWRDAVGRPEGVLTPIGGISITQPDSSRRRAVRALSSAVSSAINPYKGLRAFAEADAADFFGRVDVATALRDMLAAKTFVAVVGPSGSGKSSVVHAGLTPLLREAGMRVATMVPGDRPTVALGQALGQVAATEADTTDPSEWFRDAVGDGAGPIVLIVDQFEECWTLADGAQRERFLSALVVAGTYGVRCITTIRADLYDRPLQHSLIGPMVADATFALPPLSPQSLEEAIVRPAERNGVIFEDGVVSAIIAETNSQPAGLPLLQFAMAELYEHRIDNRVSAATLQQLGGLGGAIGRRAEEIFTSLDEGMQANTRQVFARLVAPGHGTPDTRRRARFGELSEADRVVADRFVQARLLVADRDIGTREPVIEVAHEALLTNWLRLREWLDADRRWLGQLQHLATVTRAWEDTGRPEGELYRGSRLEGVLEALPEHGGQLTADELGFVEASRAVRDGVTHRERRNARRLRRALIATVGLLVLALVAGGLALTQRQQSRDAADRARAARDAAEADRATAESSQRDAKLQLLIGSAQSLRATQVDTAALLAVEAHRLADTARSRSALFSIFTGNAGVLGLKRLPKSVASDSATGVVLPDGKTALVVDVDQSIRPYDLDTGEVGAPWSPRIDKFVSSSNIISSPDGRLVAQIGWKSASDTGIISTVLGVYDTQTRTLIFGPLVLQSLLEVAVFNADGTRLYVSSADDGNVTVYSIPAGQVVAHLDGLPHGAPGQDAAGLAFVADGLLAVGSVLGPIRLVNPTTMAEVRRIDSPRGTSSMLTSFDNGRSLIAGGSSGRIRVDLPTGRIVWRFDQALDPFAFGAPPNACAIEDERNRLYCEEPFGRIVERDLSTGGLVRTLDTQNGGGATLWIADSGNELVSFSGTAPIVVRWRLDGSGLVSKRVDAGGIPATYSPDGRSLIVWRHYAPSDGYSIPFVVDPIDGRTIDSLRPANAWTRAGWTDDRTLFGVAPQGAGVPPRIESYNRGATITASSLTIPGLVIGQVFESKHRIWVQVSKQTFPGFGGSDIWTIDKDTMQRIEPTLHVAGFQTGSGSDDGSRVAVVGTSVITIFDGRSGTSLGTIDLAPTSGTQPPLVIATVVPGGRLIVDSSAGDLTTYDIETHEVLHALRATSSFSAVSTTDDGSLAEVTGSDHSVALYDVDSGEQIGDRLVIPDAEAVASALRPDGKELAIGGGTEQAMMVWDLDPQHWETAACKLAGRNLTQDEWNTYIGDLAEYHRTCPEFA